MECTAPVLNGKPRIHGDQNCRRMRQDGGNSVKKDKGKVKLYIIAAAASLVIVAIMVTAVMLFKNGTETYRSIRIVELDGGVTIERTDVGKLEASVNMNLVSGDRVNTADDAYVVLRLDEDKYVMLGERGTIEVEAEGSFSGTRTAIRLESGSVLNEIQNPLGENDVFEIVTPSATMSVRGTVFEVRNSRDNAEAEVLVFEGTVEVGLEGLQPALYQGGEYTSFTSQGTPQFLTERSVITEECMNVQMLDRLKQIEDNGRDLDFGDADIDKMLNMQEDAAQTVANIQDSAAEPTDAPEATEMPTNTPEATEMPTNTPSPTAEPTRTPQATVRPTRTPQATVEPTRTPEPTAEPPRTPEPTVEPPRTPEPTAEPPRTPEPTAEPPRTPEPTAEPTRTPEPTVEPPRTPEPTVEPTHTPEPTVEPTPGEGPTERPGDGWHNDGPAALRLKDLWKTEPAEGEPTVIICYMPAVVQDDGDGNINSQPKIYRWMNVEKGQMPKEPEAPLYTELMGGNDSYEFVKWVVEDEDADSGWREWNFDEDEIDDVSVYLFPVWQKKVDGEEIQYWPVVDRVKEQCYLEKKEQASDSDED